MAFRFLRAVAILGITVGGAALLLFTVLRLEYARRLAQFDLREVRLIPQRSVVYDAHGVPLSYIQGENRFLIPLRRVPKNFIDALLAREDARFWTHSGLDYAGIARAALVNLRGGEVRQGASTITQQLARNSFHLTERTLDRKIVEALLAWKIEERFSKEQILEFYLNRVYFGSGAYGLQRAAQVYFGKDAGALTLGECATLAGVIRSPGRTSPLTDPEAAREQRDIVLGRMSALGMLSPEAAARVRQEPLEVRGGQRLPSQDSDVMDAVRRELDRMLSAEQIFRGGLRIYTTIDPVLQKEAEKALRRRTAEIEAHNGGKNGGKEWPHPLKAGYVPAAPGQPEKPTRYLQAALIAIDNRSGAIRALVGGRDHAQSQFDRACLARRQVGSTFKPFVYATAFAHGLLPGSWVGDWRIAPGEYPDIPKTWSPDNSDGQYGGWLPAAVGLIRSRNTMSVRVGEFAGLDAVCKTAERLGLRPVPRYPASFLGGFETTLRDLTSAYTAFPNGGIWSPSFLIARIVDASGKVLYDAGATEMRARVRAMDRGAAELTSGLLGEVLRHGTAARAARLGLTKAAAGKTGTTNECRDAWFVGYTRSLTCGVWVGFDKPQPIMPHGYGATLALPIWVDFIQAAPEASYPSAPLPTRVPHQRAVLCAQTGLRATLGCQNAGSAYTAELPAGMMPSARCAAHDAWIPVRRAEPVAPADPWAVPAPAPTQAPGATGALPPGSSSGESLEAVLRRALHSSRREPRAPRAPHRVRPFAAPGLGERRIIVIPGPGPQPGRR